MSVEGLSSTGLPCLVSQDSLDKKAGVTLAVCPVSSEGWGCRLCSMPALALGMLGPPLGRGSLPASTGAGCRWTPASKTGKAL